MTPQEFKAIRASLHLAQWQLARLMVMRPETISRAETGSRPISRKMAQHLLDLAGLTKCPTCGHPVPAPGETP